MGVGDHAAKNLLPQLDKSKRYVYMYHFSGNIAAVRCDLNLVQV